MKSLTQASRINTALQVIQHMNEGMSVVEACQTVGIPRSSYYYIVKNNPDAIAEIQALVDTHNREQLLLILTNKTGILQKLIATALADTTKPRERLAIYKTLNEIMVDFTRDLQLESKASNQ
jgi:ACT domain-containing protein